MLIKKSSINYFLSCFLVFLKHNLECILNCHLFGFLNGVA